MNASDEKIMWEIWRMKPKTNKREKMILTEHWTIMAKQTDSVIKYSWKTKVTERGMRKEEERRKRERERERERKRERERFL